MTNPSTGRFTWHEIMTTDVSAAVSFYTTLLGWRTEVMDMGPAGKYTLFLAGQAGVGGCMSGQPGVPSHWLGYVGSDDVDKTMARVAEHGGKVMVPAMDIPGMVRFSIGMDPQGAAFGVVKNLDPKADVPPPAGPPAPGTFCWDELHTSDQDAAGKFYGKVLGWSGKAGDDPMKYWHWKNGDKDVGGMMTLQMPGVPPHWLAYIAAADVDAMVARAKTLGAKVLMEPTSVEHVGRFGVLQDPTGAAFALFRSRAGLSHALVRVSSRFEAGSIRLVSIRDPGDIALSVVGDASAPFKQWFAFAVHDAEGVALTMRVLDAGECTYAAGFEGYSVCASYDGASWFRVPTSYDDGVLVIEHVPRSSRVTYAYYAPYQRKRLAQVLRRVARASRVRVAPVARSLRGEDLSHVTFASTSRNPLRVWITAQQHPGEAMAGWFAEGLLVRLAGGDETAAAIRERAEVHVVPRMNPDGALLGHHRTNGAGVDLNRAWWDPPADAPEVIGVRSAMHERRVDLFLDIHGDEQVPYVFAAGATGSPRVTPRIEALEERFAEAMVAASPAFQTENGYPRDLDADGAPRCAADHVGQGHDCLALTLEMPFSDDANDPDGEVGWSPERSVKLGADTLDAILAVLPHLR